MQKYLIGVKITLIKHFSFLSKRGLEMKSTTTNENELQTIRFNVDFPPTLNHWCEIEAKKKGESKKLFVRKCVEKIFEDTHKEERAALLESKINQLEMKLNQILTKLDQLQK